MPTSELHPMTVGEILNTAVHIYWTRFWTLFRVVGVFILPIEVLFVIVFTTSTSGGANAISELLLVMTGQLATAACLKAVSDTYLGHPTTWRASFDFVWSRIGRVIVLAVIEVIIVGIGFLLVIAPGVYLLIALLVATPALLLENLSPIDALKRSRSLVQGMWLRTAGCYVLASVFVFLVALIPTLVFIRFTATSHGVTQTHPLAGQIASVVTSLLTTPFMAAVVVLIYYDLRVRKEGLQLDDLARGVAVDPSQIDRGLFERPDEPPYPDSYR